MKNVLCVCLLSFLLSACIPMSRHHDAPQIYKVPEMEARWIREGEPLIYNDLEWFPTDETEIYLDSEVIRMGEYRGVEYFVSKTDVMPFNRFYTKFSKNHYRYFKLKQQ